MTAAALALLGVLASTWSVQPAVSVGVEHDSNARRLPEAGAPIDDVQAAGEPVVPDEVVRALLRAAVQGDVGRVPLSIDVDVGGKLFATWASENMAAGQVRGSAVLPDLPGGSTLTTTVLLRGRGQSSGLRTSALGRVDAVVDVPVMRIEQDAPVVVRAGVSASGQGVADSVLLSSGALGVVAGLRAGGRERLDVVLDASARSYPWAAASSSTGALDDTRLDVPLLLGVQLSSLRRVLVTAGYTALRNGSNARGERYVRHRVEASCGAPLPGDVVVSARGALQLTQYDDGISLGQRYFLAADDETQNLLEVAASRALWGPLSVEGRALYASNELATDGARFSRVVVGVSLRGAW